MISNPSDGHPGFFVSAKTTAGPIPARHPALRTALVHASLDPAVRSISRIATGYVGRDPMEVDAVVLHRDDGRFLLDVVPARTPLKFDELVLRGIALRNLGLATLTVTSADLSAEPLRSNADLAWSHRGRPVPVDLRLGILEILLDDGPLSLGQLLQRVLADREPAAAVMALACDNLVELDLKSGPVGPATLVRSRA
jgi:hypothetical protein